MQKKSVQNVSSALALVQHYEESQTLLLLDHGICLYATALQKFSQRQLANFHMEELRKLMKIYNMAHQGFMNLTANLLQQMEQAKLMEVSFDIALVSKMKAANKFYQKAQVHMFAGATAASDNSESLRRYFHNIAASLSNCIDVNVDVMRSTEAAFMSSVRRAKSQNKALEAESVIKAGLNSIKDSQQQLQLFRQLVEDANINVSHDTILIKFMALLQKYVIPNQKLKPLLS